MKWIRCIKCKSRVKNKIEQGENYEIFRCWYCEKDIVAFFSDKKKFTKKFFVLYLPFSFTVEIEGKKYKGEFKEYKSDGLVSIFFNMGINVLDSKRLLYQRNYRIKVFKKTLIASLEIDNIEIMRTKLEELE